MLSYSAILPYEKATLPSVEMWGTNMNILRDPPKGIFTRRKDRVGDTQQILLQQDESGSRINECINVYARNTNPMVGVSYNNYGNSQRSTSASVGGGSARQATLPYKVDVVRPPILSPYDLQPLSRLPRTWFHASTNPEFPGLVQNLQCQSVDKHIEAFNLRSSLNVLPNKNGQADTSSDASRVLQTNRNLTTPLQYDVETTRTSHLQKTGIMDKDLKSVRENSLLSKDVLTAKSLTGKPSTNQLLKTMNLSKKPVSKSSVSSNKSITSSAPLQSLSTSHLAFNMATKPRPMNVQSQKSCKLQRQKTSVVEMFLQPNVPHHSATTNASSASYQKMQYADKLRELKRKSPVTETVNTPKTYNFDVSDTAINRKKQLLDRLTSFGGFENAGSAIPNPRGVQDRHVSTSVSIDNARSALKEKMMRQMPQ